MPATYTPTDILPAITQPTAGPAWQRPTWLNNLNPQQWHYLGRINAAWDAPQSITHAASCALCHAEITALATRPRGRHHQRRSVPVG